MDPLKTLASYFYTGKFATGETVFYSTNRGEANARLFGLMKFCARNGFQDPSLSLIVASAGEIMNNSFDHNIAHWQDIPGCILMYSMNENVLTLGIADRGRGIPGSLKRVFPAKNDSELLAIAFEQIVSGRSPEKRGNGLKFVKQNIVRFSGGLLCISGRLKYSIGQVDVAVENAFSENANNDGTLMIIQWRRP